MKSRPLEAIPISQYSDLGARPEGREGSQRLGSGVRTRAPQTNLEPLPTRLVGRQLEIDSLRNVVRRERLLTIVGAPGIGKTRLAHECALRLHDEIARDGGLWSIDLTEASGVDGVAAAIGRALEIEVGAGGEASIAAIGAAFAARGRSLIILDNADHVTDALGIALDKWMRVARDARFIVTSRVRLSVSGEAVFELGPLSLPIPSLDPIASDAVKLFVERARGARPDFALDREQGQSVSALVRELDGNALGIEALAARMRDLRPSELLTALIERFAALAGGARRGRQVALRIALDLAWEALSDDERATLSQASAFAGGFDVETAERVIVTAGSVSASVRSLQAKSLLSAVTALPRHAPPRLTVVPSVREYAWGKLTTTDERDAVAERLARVVLERATRDAAALHDRNDSEARGRLNADADNLLAIHRRAVASCACSRHAEQALVAAVALDALFSATGPHALRIALLDRALAAAAGHEVAAPLLARAYSARGDVRRAVGQSADAARDYADALAIAEPTGEVDTHARVLHGLGLLALEQGQPLAAAEHFERAIALHRKTGDRAYEGRALAFLGIARTENGEEQAAREAFERALGMHQSIGDRAFEGQTLVRLAEIAHDEGRLDDAKKLALAALSPANDLDDARLEAEATARLAAIAHEQGAADHARELYNRALAALPKSSGGRVLGAVLGGLSRLLVEQRETEEARLMYSRALSVLRDTSDRITEALVLGGMAALEARESSLDSARAALHRATECVRTSPARARALAAIETDRGHLELALARQARKEDDEARSAMYLNAVENRIGNAEEMAKRSASVRIAVRALREALTRAKNRDSAPESPRARVSDAAPLPPTDDLPADALLVCARGRWFRAPFGQQVPISRWQALQNLVVKLAERREIAPGEPLTVEDLIAAGWPGERILPKAGATRVYTALSTLRRLGLRDVLAREGGGYMLSADVPLVRVSPKG